MQVTDSVDANFAKYPTGVWSMVLLNGSEWAREFPMLNWEFSFPGINIPTMCCPRPHLITAGLWEAWDQWETHYPSKSLRIVCRASDKYTQDSIQSFATLYVTWHGSLHCTYSWAAARQLELICIMKHSRIDWPHTDMLLMWLSSASAELQLHNGVLIGQGSHCFGRKKFQEFSRSFPVQFYNFPGAFSHSSQPNIKHIWLAIVTKPLPNITEYNNCQWTWCIPCEKSLSPSLTVWK